MKINAEYNNEYRINTEEEFKNFSEARMHEDKELSYYSNPLKHRIFAVPKTLLDGVISFYDEMEDPQGEDFDDEGMLKHYHEDERIDEFIRHFVTAYKENTKFCVTVEFVVQADTEEEAEEMVNVGCRHIDYINCDFTGTEECD
jgi:hypothetical protein